MAHCKIANSIRISTKCTDQTTLHRRGNGLFYIIIRPSSTVSFVKAKIGIGVENYSQKPLPILRRLVTVLVINRGRLSDLINLYF